jgi:uncharacterized delta-60 repeat protein
MIRAQRFAIVACLAGVTVALLTAGSPAALAAPTSLDTSFGVDGVVYMDIGSARVTRTGLQPDGKILVATSASALLRFLPDGQPDLGFGTGGRVTLDPAVGWQGTSIRLSWAATYRSLLVQPGTGRILIDCMAGVWAYAPDGKVDTTFGVDGHIVAPFVADGIANGTYNRWAMASDGSFVCAGRVPTGGGDVALARYSADGRPMASFGADGVVTMDLANGSADDAIAAMVDDQGRTYANGHVQSRTYMLRLLPSGALDSSFGVDGLIHNWPLYDGYYPGPGGSIVVAGGSGIRRIRADGSRDPSFFGNNPDGLILKDGATAWTLLSDGRMVVAGYVDHGFPTFNDFVLWRYTPEGLPDETFADHGTFSIDFGSADDNAATVVRPDGRILIIGTSSIPASSSRGASYASSPGHNASGPTAGIIAQLLGGGRTGLATKLATRPASSRVTLRLKSGRAVLKAAGGLSCNGTAVADCRLKLSRSVNRRSWSAVGTAMTAKGGLATLSAKFTRRGTYYLRWSFAGTTSFRKATSATTKVVVK